MSVHAVVIRRDSDVVLELQALTDAVTGAAITTATVTARVTDAAGADLSGATWPIALAHVGDGTYRGFASHTMVIPANGAWVKILADNGPGSHSTWFVEATVTAS